MEQDNLLERLYDQWGGEAKLTAEKKRMIELNFIKEFLPEKPKGALLKRIISKKTPKKFTEEELVNKLVSMKLATDIKDAKELIPDVISREYKGRGNVQHYEFQPSKNGDGLINYIIRTYIWAD